MVHSISVALCTHNGARFIQEQVRSILEQSNPPQELVISDDASRDDTLELARAVHDRHRTVFGMPPVALKILENPTAVGVSANFERAIQATSGDLVALSDQDDLWRTDRLAVAHKEFQTRPNLDLLFGNARLVDSAGIDLRRTLFDVLQLSAAAAERMHSGKGLALLIRRNLATGATVMFRRRLLAVASPFPPYWVHDEWLAIMAAATGQIDLTDEWLIDYRQHGSNVIGVTYPTLRRKVQRTLEPRAGRTERILRQFEQFAQRLEIVGETAVDGALDLARGKVSFEARRNRLPAARLHRIRPILEAERCGEYSTFASQGRLDMLRDLLQSHSG